jgi:hypothetical protein
LRVNAQAVASARTSVGGLGLLGGISCATAQVHGEIHVKECTCV